MRIKQLAVKKFKSGGKAYIPNGKMHRYKHNIDSEKIGTPLTENGIPIVAEICDSGKCQIMQVAEIEAAEIIFTSSQSKEIEKLVKKYQDTKNEEVLATLGRKVKSYLAEAEDDTGKFTETIKKIKV